MVLRRFEQRLEHLVEGTFARVFKSGLTPLEIGRRIVREIDANQSVGVDGSATVPNHFWVYVSSSDHERFSEIGHTLTGELVEAARGHMREENYRILGPLSVSFVAAPDYPEGAFQVQPQWREAPAGSLPGALRLADGTRVPLGVGAFSVGRMEGSSLVIPDANASRNHAVLNRTETGWSVSDLGSTNGTFVNGTRITTHALLDGDVIVFGSTQATFEIG